MVHIHAVLGKEPLPVRSSCGRTSTALGEYRQHNGSPESMWYGYRFSLLVTHNMWRRKMDSKLAVEAMEDISRLDSQRMLADSW